MFFLAKYRGRIDIALGFLQLFAGVINYTYDGRTFWGQQFSGARTSLNSMAMNSDDRIMMSGIFTEEVTFGPWTLNNYDGFKNFVTCLSGDIYTKIISPSVKKEPVLFPNPAQDHIQLQSRLKITRAEMYNLLGAGIKTIEGHDLNTLDISTFNPGSYFLRLTLEDGSSNTTKLIITR